MLTKHLKRRPGEIRPPAALLFGIGGFTGHSWELAWTARQLWFREDDHGQGLLSQKPWQPYEAPSSMDWMRLHDLLTRVRVWEGPKQCFDLAVVDGTQWSLKIQWGRLRRNIYGDNTLPDGFEELERAIRGLAARVDLRQVEDAYLPH